MPTIFQCPVCQLPLEQEDRHYQCENGHSFDCAREGYVNLLLANQKRSQDPGDSREMIRSRKAFLAGGYYQALAEALLNSVRQGDCSTVLDAGCGEGYYTDFIQQQMTDSAIYGIDISKDAVRYASKLNKNIAFAVANVALLPVQDDSVECVLSVFAPRESVELKRILKTDGILITASPAPTHLLELRQIIYDEVRPYNLLEVDAFAPEFEQLNSQQVTYQIHLDTPDDIANLLQMTPFYWHSPSNKRDAMLALTDLELQIAFEVATWRILS